MELWMVIAPGAALAAAVVAVTTLIIRAKQRRRSAALTSYLHRQFGPNYATAVGEHELSDAEAGLPQQDHAAGQFPLNAFTTNEVLHYAESRPESPGRFEGDPSAALNDPNPYLLRRGLGPRQR